MNAPVTLDQVRTPVATASTAVVQAGFFDLAGFELLQRVAKAFATSTLVPQAFQGNVANCMIALNLARRLNADELMVMQNLYIVHGNPGWSSKFLIACVNTCGRYESLRYEWKGNPGDDDYGCRAWTIEKSTGERLQGVWVDWKMVKAEGWNKKSGSKWLTMPDQMFIYRSAAFWQRGYAPEISMGLSSAEELADVVDVRADGTVSVTTEALRTDMTRVAPDLALGHQPSPTLQQAPQEAPGEQREAVPAARQRARASAPVREINQAEQAQVEAAQGGEQTQAAPDDGFNIEAFADRIAACQDAAALEVMAQDITDLQNDEVINGDQANTLFDVYERRKGDLAKPAPSASPAPAPTAAAGTRRRAAANPTQQSID